MIISLSCQNVIQPMPISQILLIIMNPLSLLSAHICSYNLTTQAQPLPTLKIAIIYKQQHREIVDSITTTLGCHPVQSYAIMGIEGYEVKRSDQGVEVHQISSLDEEGMVKDEDFVRRRKLVQRLNQQKSTIFVYFEREPIMERHDRSEILELKRVDATVSRSVYWNGTITQLFTRIIKTWESIARYDLISCLSHLKTEIKRVKAELRRETEWVSVREGDIGYALGLVSRAKDYLVCSLQGYYSRESSYFPDAYSVHWQIMDIFSDLWKEEGDRLHQQLQRMPLSYIGQTLKQYDHNTLGGFLPESCFLMLFRPLLLEFAEAVQRCLQGAKFKVLRNMQTVYQYYLTKANVKQAFVERQVSQIETICDSFLGETQRTINSQIDYVYAPPQAFWDMRNIQSSLYGPQQQTNIEVKYIGRSYVRRVYESIRDSIPRLIGQGLLRRVSKYVKETALNHFIDITKETPFQVTLSNDEREEIYRKQGQLKQMQVLEKYFSLKVSSTFKIKNLLDKHDRKWKKMIERPNRPQKSNNQAPALEQEEGVIGWMRRVVFGTETSNRREQKRSQSVEKDSNSRRRDFDEPLLEKTPPAITEKTWILALNTSKKIDDSAIVMASCQGFPQKLRPAIWYWLSRRNLQLEERPARMSSIMVEQEQVDEAVEVQINKDLHRTPPSKLFKGKLRGSLKRVLQAYSLMDRQLQYTQGMNFIVANILTTLTHYQIKDDYLSEHTQYQNLPQLQQKAMTIFQYVMFKRGFRKMMFIDRAHLAQLCFRTDNKIKELNENVWSIIEGSGFTVQMIFGPILISGLSTWSMNVEVQRRIMDLMLGRGFEVLYKVVAGVAAASEEPLSRLRAEGIYDYLKNKALDGVYERGGAEALTQLFLSF